MAITDKTGAAGIKHWIETHYEIQIAKHDPRIIKIKDQIDAEYAADRISAISDDEMHLWVRESLRGSDAAGKKGLEPQPEGNPKFEYRNPKQIQMTQIQMIETLSPVGWSVLNFEF